MPNNRDFDIIDFFEDPPIDYIQSTLSSTLARTQTGRAAVFTNPYGFVTSGNLYANSPNSWTVPGGISINRSSTSLDVITNTDILYSSVATLRTAFNRVLKDKFNIEFNRDVKNGSITMFDYLLSLRHWYHSEVVPKNRNQINHYEPRWGDLKDIREAVTKATGINPKGRNALLAKPKETITPTPLTVKAGKTSLFEFLLYRHVIISTRIHVTTEAVCAYKENNQPRSSFKEKIVKLKSVLSSELSGADRNRIYNNLREYMDRKVALGFFDEHTDLQSERCSDGSGLRLYFVSRRTNKLELKSSNSDIIKPTIKRINVMGRSIRLVVIKDMQHNHIGSYLNNIENSGFVTNRTPISALTSSYSSRRSESTIKPNFTVFAKDRKTYVFNAEEIYRNFFHSLFSNNNTAGLNIFSNLFLTPRLHVVHGKVPHHIDRQNFFFLRNSKEFRKNNPANIIAKAEWCPVQTVWILDGECRVANDGCKVPIYFLEGGFSGDRRYHYVAESCDDLAKAISWADVTVDCQVTHYDSTCHTLDGIECHVLLAHPDRGDDDDRTLLFSTRCNRQVREYNFNVLKVHPINNEGVDLVKGRHFGLELEMVGKFREVDVGDCVREIESNTFIVKRDGSINVSSEYDLAMELVSAPSSLKVIEREVKRVLTDKVHYRVNDSCGIHIHASRKSISETTVVSLKEFFANPFNQHFLNVVSRRHANQYCRRTHDRIYKDFLISPETGLEIKVPTDAEKYRAINAMKDSTIEFRNFASSIDPDTIMFSLQFCDAILDFLDVRYNPNLPSKQERLDHKNFILWLVDKKNLKEFDKKWPQFMAFAKVTAKSINN